MSTSPLHCYHCHSPLAQGGALTLRVAGHQRAFCCTRCRDTAEWIEQTGLSDFYHLRDGPSARPESATDARGWASQRLRQHVLRDKKDGLKEVCLLVDGMHCAGCAWLIERALLKLGHVSDIQINPVTHRARLSFDDTQVSLSDILDTISHAGYDPRPLQTEALNDARTQESRDLLKRLLVAGFGMMQVMTYAFVQYMNNFHPLPGGTMALFRWLGFLVATPVVFYAALPFFRGAQHALRLRSLNMDVPIAIAVAAVYVASVLQVTWLGGEVYFDSVSMLVFFLLAGRFVEMRARHRSVDTADALVHLTPTFTQRRGHDGRLEKTAVVDLQINDLIQVDEGGHIPTDGELLTSHTLLDESLLSGEVNARQRLRGDALIAGAIVLDGPIDLRVTRVGADTFLSKLSHLSTQAQTERPKLARRSQRATARFVARVLVLTAITCVGWLIFDPARALEATIAVLVVACPCALGLAAPAAITRALGVLAKLNILVVHPDALDTITRIDHAIFDKTGTLTQPSLNTTTDPRTLQLAASLARESQHPLSRALVAANQQPLLAATEAQQFAGMGLEGVVDGRKLRLGQPRFALDPTQRERVPEAALVLGEDGQLLAHFMMDERVRDDAADTIQALQNQGIACELLSGDSKDRATHIRHTLNITHGEGRMTPADKLARVQQRHDEGRCVLAVGDGSNDAPVLGGADISAALTSGAELAQANADILICSGRLNALHQARNIAAQTQRIMRQNERWAIGYNTVAMPLAALGFIPPWLAAILMSASSLIVVSNALRIGKRRVQNTTHQQAPA